MMTDDTAVTAACWELLACSASNSTVRVPPLCSVASIPAGRTIPALTSDRATLLVNAPTEE